MKKRLFFLLIVLMSLVFIQCVSSANYNARQGVSGKSYGTSALEASLAQYNYNPSMIIKARIDGELTTYEAERLLIALGEFAPAGAPNITKRSKERNTNRSSSSAKSDVRSEADKIYNKL